MLFVSSLIFLFSCIFPLFLYTALLGSSAIDFFLIFFLFILVWFWPGGVSGDHCLPQKCPGNQVSM